MPSFRSRSASVRCSGGIFPMSVFWLARNRRYPDMSALSMLIQPGKTFGPQPRLSFSTGLHRLREDNVQSADMNLQQESMRTDRRLFEGLAKPFREAFHDPLAERLECFDGFLFVTRELSLDSYFGRLVVFAHTNPRFAAHPHVTPRCLSR